MTQLLTLIVILPLVGFLLNGLLGNRLGKGFVSIVGCGLPILAFLAAVMAVRTLLAGEGPLIETAFRWALVGDFPFAVSFYLGDPDRGGVILTDMYSPGDSVFYVSDTLGTPVPIEPQGSAVATMTWQVPDAGSISGCQRISRTPASSCMNSRMYPKSVFP